MLFARSTRVNTIRDFGPDDRIAVSALRVGLAAILAQMAAAQAFGPQAWNRCENIMVEMPQAEAFAALTRAAPNAITAHICRVRRSNGRKCATSTSRASSKARR